MAAKKKAPAQKKAAPKKDTRSATPAQKKAMSKPRTGDSVTGNPMADSKSSGFGKTRQSQMDMFIKNRGVLQSLGVYETAKKNVMGRLYPESSSKKKKK